MMLLIYLLRVWAALSSSYFVGCLIFEDLNSFHDEDLSNQDNIKIEMYPQAEDFYKTFNIPIWAEVNSRSKRVSSLAFPPRTYLICDYHFNVPMFAPARVFTPLIFQGKLFMVMPNITLSLVGDVGRNLRERMTFFTAAEQFFEGFRADGKSCVLRALCEKSEYDVISDGILSEIVTLLLEFSSPSADTSYAEYEAARDYGRLRGNCAQKYASCSLSIFSFFN